MVVHRRQRIAEAIGENERTVARRGSALIADGTVKIRGVRCSGPWICPVDQQRTRPGANDVDGLGQAVDSTMWVHLTTGSSDVIGAVAVPEWMSRKNSSLTRSRRLPEPPNGRHTRSSATCGPPGPGGRGCSPHTSDRDSSTSCPQAPELKLGFEIDLDSHDAAILKVLKEDGRQSYDELARQVGTSVATVRRRLDRLRCEGKLQIRVRRSLPATSGSAPRSSCGCACGIRTSKPQRRL